MEKSKILNEIEKWQRIAETNDTNNIEIKSISDEIKKIEYNMLQYLLKKYDTNLLLQSLKAKHVIGDSGEIIVNDGIIIDESILNFGCDRNKYYLNPKSAMMLYNCYLDFANGIIHKNIRQDIDYSSLKYDELYSLNPYECIYWCYVHNITFTDFAKMNFVHECAHRFGSSLSLDLPHEPFLCNIVEEGITEIIARNYALAENKPYIPIFRETEVEFVKYFYDIDDIVEFILYFQNQGGAYNAACFLFLDNDEIDEEKLENLLVNAAGSNGEINAQREKNGTKINQDDSFMIIFDKIALRKEYEKFIERTEQAMNNNREY